jgi:hypothetical protein
MELMQKYVKEDRKDPNSAPAELCKGVKKDPSKVGGESCSRDTQEANMGSTLWCAGCSGSAQTLCSGVLALGLGMLTLSSG